MISDHLPNIKSLIVDMDGVLWRDTQPIGDLQAIFQRIRDLGFKTILATNNSTRTIDEYQQKLAQFGVDLEDWQILTTGQAVGIYLSEKYPDGAKVYVIGQSALKRTLETYNLTVVDERETDARCVVASMDFGLTYEKLKIGSLLIQAGADFIGTNPDATLPTPEGFIPGSGTVIGALEIASSKGAIIIGKPEPLLYQMALKRLDCDPQETLAIGDRLETDIAGAQAAGIHSAMVLTGASTLQQAQNFDTPPDIIAQNLTELID